MHIDWPKVLFMALGSLIVNIVIVSTWGIGAAFAAAGAVVGLGFLGNAVTQLYEARYWRPRIDEFLLARTPDPPDPPMSGRDETATVRRPIDMSDRAQLLELVSKVIDGDNGCAAVTPGKSSRFVETLDADSLLLAELVVDLEDRTGIVVRDDDLSGVRTVGDFLDVVQRT